MIKKSSIVDGLIYLFIASLTLLVLVELDFSRKDPLTIATFLLNGTFFFVNIIYSKQNISLRRLFYIFNFIFLFLAPISQYASGVVLWRGNGVSLSYSDNDYLFANCIIFLFCLIFEITYKYKRVKKKNVLKNKFIRKQNFKTFLILDLISVIVFGFLLFTHNIFGREALNTGNQNLGTQIINICKGIPLAVLANQIIYWNRDIKYKKFLIFIPVLEIGIIFFPFWGSVSRFLLFGAYLTIISLIYSNSKHKSFYPLLFVIGFGFVFSAFNFFKSNGFSNISNFSIELINFNHVDYDAYQMLMATIKYVKVNGTCLGINILSTVLSFVPRSIWMGKAAPSGEIIIGSFGSWFTNVSCPWIAEWYFSFGITGTIIGSWLSGYGFKVIDSYCIDEDHPLMRGVFAVVTGLSIYILRGALLPAWSYTFAIILAFLFVNYVNKVISKCIT